jgi:glutathione S-transferase
MGTVPFLQDGEVAMNESIAIMLYLAERYGPTPLLPKDDPATLARIFQLMVFTEATFGAGMNVLMAAHFGAPEADKQNWSQRVQADVNARALTFIENALADAPYITGPVFTLADIAISTALGIWKGALGKDIPPRLAEWRDRLAERPTCQRAQAAQQR